MSQLLIDSGGVLKLKGIGVFSLVLWYAPLNHPMKYEANISSNSDVAGVENCAHKSAIRFPSELRRLEANRLDVRDWRDTNAS
jgi:hypothetical protein